MELDFFWVAVSELQEATKFYNNLLEKKPDFKSERLVYYEFGPVKFALYNTDYDGWKPEKRGDNSAPAFRVEDFEEEKQRIENLVDEVNEYDAGDHIGFTFTDPDGNLLEVYSWKD